MVDRTSGYGFALNELIVIDGVLHKKYREGAPHEAADKILDEIYFYEHIHNSVRHLFPHFHGTIERGFMLEFLPEAVPLISRIDAEPSCIRGMLRKLQDILGALHGSSSVIVDTSIVIADLEHEMKHKIIARLAIIRPLISRYSPNISRVNGMRVPSVDELECILENLYQKFVGSLNLETTRYHMIHGDPQFNNVMCGSDRMWLIDPRGRFGHTRIMGLTQYDDAKLLFALSGYDRFDRSDICDIGVVSDHEIVLPQWLKPLNHDLFMEEWSRQPDTRLLFYTIWLGNGHMFAQTNPYKALCSYYYALYLLSFEPSIR